MSANRECLNIKTHTSTRFQLENIFSKFKYMRLCYINFSANYKNISANLQNNTLQLTSSLNITIPDGTYTINDINTTILNTPISTFYYKLHKNLQNASYDVYRYANASDWQQNINGTKMIFTLSTTSLNYKLSL